MITVVPPAHLEKVWPHVRAFIEAALNRTKNVCYWPDDIRMAVKRGDMMLWISVDDEKRIEAAVITELHNWPRQRWCAVPFIGGRNLKSWLPGMMQAIESYARDMGCDAMVGGGREGWAKAAGYRKTGVVLRKEL